MGTLHDRERSDSRATAFGPRSPDVRPPHRRRRLLVAAGVAAIVVGASVWSSYHAPSRSPGASAKPGSVAARAPEGGGDAATTTIPLPGATAFDAVTIDGVTFTVPAGKPTALLFVTTGCGTCLDQAAQLDRVAQQYGDRVALIAIEIDPWASIGDVRKFGQDAGGVHYPLAIDMNSKIHNQLRAYALDTVIVLDGAGRVVYREINPELGSIVSGLRRAGLS